MTTKPSNADFGGNYNTDNNKERFERAGFKVHEGYKASDGNIPINFNAPYDVMAKEIHQFNVNKGWWDAFLPDRKLDRCETALMLVVSELAEAMEGCRKDLMDDKLPEFPMFDVELADAMIRLLDLGGAVGLNLNMLNDVQTELRRRSKPEQLWFIVENLAIAKSNANVQVSIGVGILLIKYLAGFYNIDIRMVMEKKMIFNATREDHLRENRAKDNGKKF